MRRRSVDTGESLFSPAVDVLANSMLIMFIYSVVFLVTKGRDPDRLTLLPCNPPPVIGGFPYDYTLPRSGGMGTTAFRLTQGELPEGLTFDLTNGRISGSASPDARPGKYEIVVAAKDETAEPQQPVVLRLWPAVAPLADPRPQIKLLQTSEDLPPGRSGSIYETVLGQQGGVGPIEWRFAADQELPPDLGLQLVDGRLVGTPMRAGKFQFAVEAAFSGGEVTLDDKASQWSGGEDRRTYQLHILPQLSGNANWPMVRIGEVCSAGLLERLLPGESVEYDPIPAGLAIQENGALAGTPREVGDHKIEFRVRRGENQLTAGEGQLRVLPALESLENQRFLQTTRLGDRAFRVPVPLHGLLEPVKITAATDLPKGVSIDGAEIVVTPTVVGMERIPLKITDAADNQVEREFFLRTLPKPPALAVGLPDEVDMIVGRQVSIPVPLLGGEGEYTVQLEVGPPGLHVADRKITGLVTQPGEWRLTILAVEDASKRSATKELTVRANYGSPKPLRIVTDKLPLAIKDKPYYLALAYEGSLGSEKWDFDGRIPAGMQFENGVLSGSPTEIGNFRFTIDLKDIASQHAAGSLALECRPLDETQPQILGNELPPAALGEHYVTRIPAEGGIGAYKWELQGQLPAGLEFLNGELRGRPTQAGSYRFAAVVKDEYGQSAPSKDLTLLVREVAQLAKLEVATAALPTGITGQPFQLTLAARGAVGKAKWTIIGGSLPLGLELRDDQLTGTASAIGEHPLQFQCEDELGRTAVSKQMSLSFIRRSEDSPGLRPSPNEPEVAAEQPTLDQPLDALRGLSPAWFLLSLALNLLLGIVVLRNLVSRPKAPQAEDEETIVDFDE